jgi:hypothetical protein
MQDTFLAACESVAADLRSAQRNPDGSLQFTIPRNHIDLWLSAMNQARLTLAEIHQFTNDDLSRPRPTPTIRGSLLASKWASTAACKNCLFLQLKNIITFKNIL